MLFELVWCKHKYFVKKVTNPILKNVTNVLLGFYVFLSYFFYYNRTKKYMYNFYTVHFL